MDGGIDADTPLDYVAFRILPTQNRYEAFICCDNKIEKLASGLLEHLVLHLPHVKDLDSEGSDGNVKLQLPGNLKDSTWFTKSTVTRFLNIVNTPDMVKLVDAIEDEISQLEEARRFHLSLYSQGHQDPSGNGEAGIQSDECDLNDTVEALKIRLQISPSEFTKSELLRAMDSRLLALRDELAAAFNKAAGATCSAKDIINLATFCQNFGASDLRNSLCKYPPLSQKNQVSESQNEKSVLACDARNDSTQMIDEISHVSMPVNNVKPVKYGASPAKIAQIERQSSTESEISSKSSDEDRSIVDRSRPIMRSTTPKRSASPMRRIQIGRSGSRRAAALTIRSLGYLPPRERVSCNRDAATNSSEEESDQPQKKTEHNVQRMSVQDAINLFESKQKDQNTDLQKKRFLTDISLSTNKSVLRRWSAGMGDSSVQYPPENASESTVQVTPNNFATEEVQRISEEMKPESDLNHCAPNPVETANLGSNFDIEENITSFPTENPADSIVAQGMETHGRVKSSAEWNQQKEAELNQMLTKMMERKPGKYQNKEPGNRKNHDRPSDKRGGLYDHYKEKRDEKLRGRNSGQRAEKEAQFKGVQEVPAHRKAEMTSKNAGNVRKKDSLGKPQKLQNISPPSAQTKKETSKPATSKKALPKSSPVPATRKSWPSAPSPRSTGISPAKTSYGIFSTGTTLTCRKSPSTSSPNRPKPKVEKSQKQQRNLKGNLSDHNQGLTGSEENKQQLVKKGGKTTKLKVLPASGDDSSMVLDKDSFYGKVTKKSSVVPLESKSFLRKGSGIGPGISPVVKTKTSSQSEESLRNSGNLIQAQANEVVSGPSEPVVQQQVGDLVPISITKTDLESEASTKSHQECEIRENSDQFVAIGDYSVNKKAESPVEVQADDELTISSVAWVETGDHHEVLLSCDKVEPQLTIPANVAPVALSSPRVRHSLSQMLQEDNGESDIIEWGNAENPPALVYQKDSPKGLKRLLKFGRKSRGDMHVSGWSSPSVFSEGEDDVEEPKATSKRNADNLLRKATLQAKGMGQHNSSVGESTNSTSYGILPAQSNESKFGYQSSTHKLREGHISAAGTSSKATRSFFSLSTFRSSKSNETKLR